MHNLGVFESQICRIRAVVDFQFLVNVAIHNSTPSIRSRVPGIELDRHYMILLGLKKIHIHLLTAKVRARICSFPNDNGISVNDVATRSLAFSDL